MLVNNYDKNNKKKKKQVKPNHRNAGEGGLRDRGGETPGRGSWTKRKAGASLAAAEAAAEVHGGNPDLAAGGENAAAAGTGAGAGAGAVAVAGAGAGGCEDHCTSLRLRCGDRERGVGLRGQ